MRPSHTEPFGSQRSERSERSERGERGERDNRAPWTTQSPSMPTNASIPAVRSEDSWIEIPSRPSSSSLSSASNDIITTGLQIRSQEERLSRQLHTSPQTSIPQPRSTSAAGSSQDEYEESESDSDRVMSSSNEDIYHENAADDDDTSTALGVGSLNKVFTPQPNAFSHPPSSQTRPIPDSYFPPAPSFATSGHEPDRTLTQRSYQRRTHSGNRPGTSSYQADHDAALRASLTTLLSCAAAVRPKGTENRTTPAPRPTPTQPTALRLVPESQLESPARPRRAPSPKQTKRKSRESSKERHAKKARAAKAGGVTTTEDLISPTLASWMISAGVVLVFSAISFSAGYAWGREVGRIEVEMGLPSGSCGQEALRGGGNGLRRLRWSSAASSIRA